ncbi:MAG: ABC transporter permease [Prevotellaceae bacterium]|jgi:ABC-type antimicrobial peptide transport system permease subunit|nr:ABC transporter permease [Prevotellaceae bacterium]
MKKISQYFRLTWYNIMNNKDYAFFCVLGTALTFVFVSLILQSIYVLTGNYPPMIYGDRTISVRSLRDNTGARLYIPASETSGFLGNFDGYEHAALLHTEGVTIASNKRLNPTTAGFVNSDFWEVYSFDFLEGRSFGEEDCINRKKLAVITESVSSTLFNTKNSVGKKLTLQDNEYEVCGVIKRYSFLAGPSSDNCEIFVPYVFNKFVPSGDASYAIHLLYPSNRPINQVKEEVHQAIMQYFGQQNKKIAVGQQNIKTFKEWRLSNLGGSGAIFAGGAAAIFLLLLIPAVNILSLNIANAGNRAEEIAVRKTFGASRTASFLMIMLENLMLIAVGTFIGVALTVPAFNLIQQNLLGDLVLVSQIDYRVVFTGIIPVMLLFSLMSGGLPAYFISKRNIAQTLKGGSK